MGVCRVHRHSRYADGYHTCSTCAHAWLMKDSFLSAVCLCCTELSRHSRVCSPWMWWLCDISAECWAMVSLCIHPCLSEKMACTTLSLQRGCVLCWCCIWDKEVCFSQSLFTSAVLRLSMQRIRLYSCCWSTDACMRRWRCGSHRWKDTHPLSTLSSAAWYTPHTYIPIYIYIYIHSASKGLFWATHTQQSSTHEKSQATYRWRVASSTRILLDICPISILVRVVCACCGCRWTTADTLSLLAQRMNWWVGVSVMIVVWALSFLQMCWETEN